MSLTEAWNRAGWSIAFGVAIALFLGLTFFANSAKSDVQQLERQIIAAERQKLLLETEFQARASQRQLASWNAVEFGYEAPRGDQFIEREQQLAVYASAPPRGAPEPIRIVRNVQARPDSGRLAAMVSAVAEFPIEETRISLSRTINLIGRANARPVNTMAADRSGQWQAAGLAGRLGSSASLSTPIASSLARGAE